MTQFPEEFDSIFRYIVVVSQRAEQIMKGAKPRTDTRHHKPTLIAKDDVEAGQVGWRILTQEELDARRQEIVEQFRAEVAGEGLEPAPAIRDVLPTTRAVEDDQRDDELVRLQRLLGMAGLSAGAAEEEEDEDEDEAEVETDDDLDDLDSDDVADLDLDDDLDEPVAAGDGAGD